MGSLLLFLERLNDKLVQNILNKISHKNEEERLLNIIRLHLVSLKFTDLSVAEKILNCLMDIRLEAANKYGNSYIYENFLGLQALKIFQIGRSEFAELYGLSHDDLLLQIKRYVNNEAYRNDNNITICSEAVVVVKTCTKCNAEKMSVFKSELGQLAICDRCCFSMKLE